MKKMLHSTLAAALVMMAAARAPAQDAKPVIVVSLPSIGALLKDLGYLGGLAGQPNVEKQAADAIDLIAGGLEGLDRSKPLGLTVTTDGAAFTPLLFLPVTDLDKFVGSLAGLGVRAEDAGDGTKKLSGPGGTPVFLKAKGGWAFGAQNVASLTDLPDDPTKWLGGMDKDYDIGLRVHVQNIPDIYTKLAIAGINAGVNASLQQKPDESDEDFALRRSTVKMQVDSIVNLINDLDQFTLGWSVDAAGKKLLIEAGATAKAGTKTAAQFEALKDLKTNFGGFLRDDAILSMNMVSKMTKEEAAQMSEMLAGFRKQLMNRIEGSVDFQNDDQKKVVKNMVGKLMGVLDGTVKGGRMDAGMLIYGEGPFTAAMGFHVADGAEVDKVLRDAIKLVQDEDAVQKVEFDADKDGDVTFHRITPMVPDADEVAAILGDKPEIIFGVGKTQVYFAVGTDAIKSLKEIIAKSKAAASKPAKPAQVSIALGPIVKFAANANKADENLANLAKALEGGADHIRITTRVIDNGEISRFEIEEGILKAIGVGVKAAMERFGLGAGGGF